MVSKFSLRFFVIRSQLSHLTLANLVSLAVKELLHWRIPSILSAGFEEIGKFRFFLILVVSSANMISKVLALVKAEKGNHRITACLLLLRVAHPAIRVSVSQEKGSLTPQRV